MSASSGRLLSVVGAGYTGSLLFQNQELVSEIGKNVFQVLTGSQLSLTHCSGASDFCFVVVPHAAGSLNSLFARNALHALVCWCS